MDPGDYGACRCCTATGYHRHIMKEYHRNGAREMYHEMFLDCYNIFLASNSMAGSLICSACVRRLRDATDFKVMVVEAEQQMLDGLADQETVFVNVPDGNSIADIKTEIHLDDVKLEPGDKENNVDFMVDNDSDWEAGDDLCVPVSVSKVKLMNEDVVPGETEFLARVPPGKVRPLPTRDTLYSVCRGYVKHLDSLKGKIIAPKTLEKLLQQNDYKIKLHSPKKVFVTEKLAQITNAAVLIEFSNVTPFKSKNRAGFPCFYCRTSYDNVQKLREHQEKGHRRSEARKVLATYGAECLVVYVDITDLKCSICQDNIGNISELKSHLTKTHNKKMHLDYSDRVIPFKLSESNIHECQICGFSFETFGSIERHMNVHYRNHVCKECGTGFITKYRLKVHVKSNHTEGSFPCELCKKVYTSQQKHKNHYDTVHKMVKRFKCPKCPERFTEYFRRQKHLVTVHGVAPLQYKCNVCDKAFDRRYTLSRHMKRDHLEERDYQCELCSYNCFTNNELRVHMVKHIGQRIHECSVCKKSYARKKTLKEHMRIHNNDRRFACAVCGQAFVQKCSLKGHIKTHHVEYSLNV